jgi:signal transduction histidine kinase
MGLPEFARTNTFRSAAVAAGAFAIFVLLLFGFIYRKADRYLIARLDHVIASKHVPVVDGDRDLLMEAIVNLVDNAVKFRPAGGRVEISLFRGNAESIIRVTDTGVGISELERDAVLKRFYRSEKLRNAPGFGLGLNLVAAIVKLHGFRLTVHPGSGCVVEIASPDHIADTKAGQRG